MLFQQDIKRVSFRWSSAQRRATEIAVNFRHKGVTISNPEKLPARKVKVLLEIVDRLIEVFKKAGLSNSLFTTVKMIELIEHADMKGLMGLYEFDKKKVTFYLSGKKFGDPLFTVIHEIAHHIYFHVLHEDARAEWDNPWKPILEKLDITAEDRKDFFERLRKSAWDTVKAHRSLKGFNRVKFSIWLNWTLSVPLTVDVLDPHLNMKGVLYFNAFRDPRFLIPHIKKYVPQHAAEAEKYAPKLAEELQEELKRILGLYISVPYPRLGYPGIIEKLVKHYPTLLKFFEGLKSPSEYGKSSSMEEFAEAFAFYLLKPARLEKDVRRRLQIALGLSNLYGKDIWREELS